MRPALLREPVNYLSLGRRARGPVARVSQDASQNCVTDPRPQSLAPVARDGAKAHDARSHALLQRFDRWPPGRHRELVELRRDEGQVEGLRRAYRPPLAQGA